MKTKIFTLIALCLLAFGMNVNAQDADKFWNLVVYDLDTVEVDRFNVDNITDLVILNQTEFAIEVNGSDQYPFVKEGIMMKFELRGSGATSNDDISAGKWKVSYVGGNLHIDNPVGPVTIYNMMGQLIGKYPNVSDISVNLTPNIYIVQSGQYAAKLMVNNNNQGSATAEAKPVPVTRASNPPDFSTSRYWNLNTGDTTIPIDLETVHWIMIYDDNHWEIKFLSGNTLNIENYEGGMAISAEPNDGESYWNWELIDRLGGAAYGMYPSLFMFEEPYPECIYTFSPTHLLAYSVEENELTKVPIAVIWDKLEKYPDVAGIGMVMHVNEQFQEEGLAPGFSYITYRDSIKVLRFDNLVNLEYVSSSATGPIVYMPLTGKESNRIDAEVELNVDGSITVSYINYLGVKREYTFEQE